MFDHIYPHFHVIKETETYFYIHPFSLFCHVFLITDTYCTNSYLPANIWGFVHPQIFPLIFSSLINILPKYTISTFIHNLQLLVIFPVKHNHIMFCFDALVFRSMNLVGLYISLIFAANHSGSQPTKWYYQPTKEIAYSCLQLAAL